MLAADVENGILRVMLGGASREEAARRAGVSPWELEATLADDVRLPDSPAGKFLDKVRAIEASRSKYRRPGSESGWVRTWGGHDLDGGRR